MTRPHLHRLYVRRASHAERQEIAHKYRAGASLAALGREYGHHVDTIKKYLRDSGVELRWDWKRGSAPERAS